VVGTHKTGFLRGRVLGSRSVEVALLARSDVVVVPDTDLRLRSGVVAGIAEGPEMASIVEVAARGAQARGEELLLLHGSAELGYERGQTLVAAAREIAHAVAPEIVVTSRVSNRSIAESLLDAGRGRALLVVGAGARDPVRSPIGPLLHDILLNLTAPTRVVHARQATAPTPTKPSATVSGRSTAVRSQSP
jgi:nucleotide-binding universal stress UspA family protein